MQRIKLSQDCLTGGLLNEHDEQDPTSVSPQIRQEIAEAGYTQWTTNNLKSLRLGIPRVIFLDNASSLPLTYWMLGIFSGRVVSTNQTVYHGGCQASSRHGRDNSTCLAAIDTIRSQCILRHC